MPTGTLGSTARDFPTRKDAICAPINVANFGTAGQVVKVGVVPAGCCIKGISTNMATAFNAGTNNNLQVGNTSGGAQLVVAAAGLAAGLNAMTLVPTAAYCAADTTIYATSATSGTAATLGAGFVCVEYNSPW